ncbi:MAG: hypothetical protein SCH98_01455 [Deferrisomatales bacterium]|nr:hypothetical protein [Deferrisomatales bacterium]
MATYLGVIVLLVAAVSASAQEYRIDRPGEPTSSPVHLTQPIEGRVEVQNLPQVQDVRVLGGLEGPVEVRGELELRPGEGLAVEVLNFPEAPTRLEVEGTVRVDDERPVQVWVVNPTGPVTGPPNRTFASFGFEGAFGAKETRVQRTLHPPEGRIFHLTDLVLDARADAVLRVRLLASGAALAGVLVAQGMEPVALAVLDSRHGTTLRLGTPVPLGGGFSLEVEALGPGQGAPFRLAASGYLSDR